MERWGEFGVIVFFIISAYYFVDFKEVDRGFKYFAFWSKKLIKLWPAYAISVSLTAIVIHIWYLPDRMSSWLDWLLNIFFINGFIGTSYVDKAHWYMTTLISFYIVISLAKKFCLDKKSIFYILWIFISTILCWLDVPVISVLLGSSYVGFVCVTIAAKAIIYNYRNRQKSMFDYLGWFVVLALSLMFIAFFRGFAAVIFVVIGLALFLLCDSRKLPVFESRFLLNLGYISYPLYLCHQNLAYEIEWRLFETIGYFNYIYSVVAILIVILISVLLYFLNRRIQIFLSFLVERNGEKL